MRTRDWLQYVREAPSADEKKYRWNDREQHRLLTGHYVKIGDRKVREIRFVEDRVGEVRLDCGNVVDVLNTHLTCSKCSTKKPAVKLLGTVL